jgi:two-component system phosphate regulon response regulator PhoB
MRTVLVSIENEALRAILARVLASVPTWRVRSFEDLAAVRAYMRIVPTDLLLCDRIEDDAVTGFVAGLRADPAIENPGFSAIGLARRIDQRLRIETRLAGIAEVVVLPVSPRHILERVTAHLDRLPPAPSRENRLATRPRFSGNVVELFPGR